MTFANFQTQIVFGRTRLLVLMAAVVLFIAKSSHAESQFQPTSFPPSVSLCLHIDDLQQRYNEVESSGLKERITEFPPFRAWVRSKDFYKIQQLSLAVQALTGEPTWKVANQIFGESVFIGLVPKSANHPDLTVMSTRVKSSELLQKYLKLWNNAEQAQLTSHAFKGRKYLERRASGETVYYTTEGRDIVFASHKTAIEGVISAQTSKQNLASSEWYRAADEKFDSQVGIRLYINPRVFDAEVDWNDDLFEVFPELKELWKSTVAVTLGLRLNEGLVFDLHFRRRFDDETTRSVSENNNASNGFVNIPAVSLLAISGKTDFAWLGQRFISAMQKKSTREATQLRQVVRGLLLGNDLFDNVLTDFDGQWSLWVVPDGADNEKPVPIDAAMQLDFKSLRVESNQTTDVKALANLGKFLVNLITIGANVGLKQKSAVTTTMLEKDGQSIVFSDGIRGWSPGFAIDEKKLLLFTDYRISRESTAENSKPILASSEYLRVKQQAYFPAAQLCGWIDLMALDGFIDRAREPIIGEVVSDIDDESIRDQKKAAVTRKIDRFQQAIRLGDAMFFSLADFGTDPHANFGLLLKKP